MTDPIADLLTRLRNAGMAKKGEVIMPHSNEKESILKVMHKYRYIVSYEVLKDEKGFKILKVTLDVKKNHETSYKRISSPGQRIFVHAADLKTVKSGLGIAIVSTSAGIMSNVEAKKKNTGGEILCEVW